MDLEHDHEELAVDAKQYRTQERDEETDLPFRSCIPADHGDEAAHHEEDRSADEDPSRITGVHIVRNSSQSFIGAASHARSGGVHALDVARRSIWQIREPVGVADREVRHAAIRMMDASVEGTLPRPQRLLERSERDTCHPMGNDIRSSVRLPFCARVEQLRHGTALCSISAQRSGRAPRRPSSGRDIPHDPAIVLSPQIATPPNPVGSRAMAHTERLSQLRRVGQGI